MRLHLLFWVSAGALLFTYAGYPALLGLLSLARRRDPAPAPPADPPAASLIVPARNEADRLAAKIRNCRAIDYPPGRLEIIVVDDASTDATPDCLRDLGTEASGLRWIVLRNPASAGKAQAVNRGVAAASGDLLVFSDADTLLSPDSLRLLAAPFADPRVGCVAGRYLPGGGSGENGAAAGLYWRYEDFLRRRESENGGILGASGALYAIRRELYPPLRPGLINDDFVIPMSLAARGYRCLYEPRATALEERSDAGGREFSRRVRIMAGNCEHFRLFLPLLRDPRRWGLFLQLFCHKFLRVLSPLWLALLLPTACALALLAPPAVRPLYAALALAQFFFYGLALLGRRGRGGRLATLASFFVLINLAAAAGIYYHLFNRAALPWARAEGK